MDEDINMIVFIIFLGVWVFFICFPEYFGMLLKWIDKIIEKGGKMKW